MSAMLIATGSSSVRCRAQRSGRWGRRFKSCLPDHTQFQFAGYDIKIPDRRDNHSTLMDILEIIKTRRSVRDYGTEIPDKGLIDQIIEAARWAPSGLNNQPWKLMIVQNEELRAGLAGFTRYGQLVRSAPVSIAVCLDRGQSYHREKDIMAIGAAIQNMLLAAHARGLGACWLGEILARKQEVARYLGFPDECELMALVVVGFPGGEGGPGERKPVPEIVIESPAL